MNEWDELTPGRLAVARANTRMYRRMGLNDDGSEKEHVPYDDQPSRPSQPRGSSGASSGSGGGGILLVILAVGGFGAYHFGLFGGSGREQSASNPLPSAPASPTPSRVLNVKWYENRRDEVEVGGA